jgi:hypothetical protein
MYKYCTYIEHPTLNSDNAALQPEVFTIDTLVLSKNDGMVAFDYITYTLISMKFGQLLFLNIQADETYASIHFFFTHK